MKIVVTGGAGFIGTHYIKRLLDEGHAVTVFDKIQEEEAYRLKPIMNQIEYKTIDIKNLELLKKKLSGYDLVSHFAASADIELGLKNTDMDLKEGMLTTYNVLEAMRTNEIPEIIFLSSSTVYGNPSKVPTPEDAAFLFPISLYGSAKLASEALISAFCNLFNMKSWIFRLGNVIGSDMTRGVIKDFVRKLKQNPKKLEILGDGNQKKDFIHIDDFVEGISYAYKNSKDVVNVFNVSSGTTTSVNKVANLVIQEMNLHNVKREFTGGKSGWPGDAPLVHFDISKIQKLGWNAMYNSDNAVRRAIKETLAN